MSEAITVALITGGMSVISVILSNLFSNRKMQSKMETQQAVIDTRIDELTREVRLHNNFAQRVPVAEEKIKVLNNRVKDLEDYHK